MSEKRRETRGGLPVLFIAVIVCLGGLCCRCRLLDSLRYAEILLPSIPEVWSGVPEIRSYRIVWPGGECRIDTSRGSIDLSRAAVVELPSERYVPVLAYPEVEGARIRLSPAGGFTSLPGTSGTGVELSYRLGPAAAVFYACIRGSASGEVSKHSPVRSFNVPRFVDEFLARSGKDPWGVDLDRLEIALSTGNFRADLIRPMQSRSLTLPPDIAPPGRWIPANPCGDASESTADEGLRIEVTPGEYWYFSEEGERWIHVIADEEGWRAVSSGGSGLSGRW